jgi:hypothetical protein
MDNITSLLWDKPVQVVQERLPDSIDSSNKDTVSKLIVGTGYAAVGYGVYRIVSNRRSRSNMTKIIKNMGNSMSGNMFGKRKRRRSRKGSRKGSGK